MFNHCTARTQPGVAAALPLASRHRGAHPQLTPGLRPQALPRPWRGRDGALRRLGPPGEQPAADRAELRKASGVMRTVQAGSN